MKFINNIMGKTFNLVFGEIYPSDTECEYKSICSAYQNDSQTCNQDVDKSYCGIYSKFSQETLCIEP